MKNSDGFAQPSRRTLLKAAGAMGLSALIWPKAGFAQSQAGGTLKVRSYGDLQVLDPCFRVSEPDADIGRCIFAGLVLRDGSDQPERVEARGKDGAFFQLLGAEGGGVGENGAHGGLLPRAMSQKLALQGEPYLHSAEACLRI